MLQQNRMFFTESLKGLLVGRFMSGKTYAAASAYNATGMIDGQLSWLLRPALYIDVEGGAMSMGPMRGQPESDVRYIGVSTPGDFAEAMGLAHTGHFRLLVFDGWTHLFEKYAMVAKKANPRAKNKNMDWNAWARDEVAQALEEWCDLAVFPATRGCVMLSTAAITDHWAGEYGERHVVGEKIRVSATIEDRLVGRHNFIYHCERINPRVIMTAEGNLDIEATNAGIANGSLAPRFIAYTYPFAGMPYVKAQDGFAKDAPPIIERIDLGKMISQHHDLCGIKTTTQTIDTNTTVTTAA